MHGASECCATGLFVRAVNPLDEVSLSCTAIASESPDGCHADARGSDCSSTVQP
jgi:hypothetical protein